MDGRLETFRPAGRFLIERLIAIGLCQPATGKAALHREPPNGAAKGYTRYAYLSLLSAF